MLQCARQKRPSKIIQRGLRQIQHFQTAVVAQAFRQHSSRSGGQHRGGNLVLVVLLLLQPRCIRGDVGRCTAANCREFGAIAAAAAAANGLGIVSHPAHAAGAAEEAVAIARASAPYQEGELRSHRGRAGVVQNGKGRAGLVVVGVAGVAAKGSKDKARKKRRSSGM